MIVWISSFARKLNNNCWALSGYIAQETPLITAVAVYVVALMGHGIHNCDLLILRFFFLLFWFFPWSFLLTNIQCCLITWKSLFLESELSTSGISLLLAPVFVVCLLEGLMQMSLKEILLQGDTCMALPWWYVPGFLLYFSCISMSKGLIRCIDGRVTSIC